MAGNRATVFVYGTLIDPDRVATVLDEWRFEGAAALEGLRQVDGRHPTLAPGGRTEGRLLVTSDLDRLDAYEGVADGLYVRVAVPVVDGARAWVYVGDPERLGAADDWPGLGSFAERIDRYLEREDVVVHRSGNR